MSNKQLICAENIKLSFGEQPVLDFKMFQVYEGDKIGLVGPNGVGKTTLLRILAGELKPDTGIVKCNYTPFYFKQFEESWDSLAIDDKTAGILGVKNQVWQNTVSGGENTRIRLAELFGTPRAVAFLDEPSSNLDNKGIDLLIKKLLDIETLVLVSHDRTLINAVCNKIVDISYGILQVFPGNYDDYQALKHAQLERQQTEYEQYQTEKKRLLSVYQEKKQKAQKIESKPKGMSSSEARTIALIGKRKPEDKARSMERAATNVLKRIEHMEIKEKPKELPTIRPDFRLTNPPENPIVIRGENISFDYDGQVIYKNANFIIQNRSKVAIIGDNGSGKTTLLNLIAQSAENPHLYGKDQALYSGVITVVPKAKIGYVKQNLSNIDWNKSVLDNVMSVSIQKESIARMILARLLLSERDIQKNAHCLSGGERVKLALVMLFVSDVNLLVLDEPTNYLDLPSIEALEALLQEYEGTLLFVSHDKTFVKHIATELLQIQDGQIKKIDIYE